MVHDEMNIAKKELLKDKITAIDVRDRVVEFGPEKSRGLIGLHHFTGADWGGKFVGVSKKTWISAYFSLPSEDEIVQTFTNMGNDSQISMPR